MATAVPDPKCLPHDRNPRKPDVEMPAGACDCHAHVFGPGNTYPFISDGLYTPVDALPNEFRAMLDALGLERGVLVQPSIYGTNNEAMLDAMAGDRERLRGIAALPFDVGTSEIERLNEQGICGVRCNIVDLKYGKGQLQLDELRALAERIAPFGWHVEFLMHVNEFPDLDRQFADFPTPLVFGHFGYVPVSEGPDTDGFHALLRLMREGRAWVKMTAPNRLTLSPTPYPGVEETARRLVEAAPERLLWGTDWPHTYIRSDMPNDGDLLNLFARWVPDAETRRRILVDNPAELYGF
jgi:2-pyrone-4,6-dicarboxylate lactonase